MHPLALLEPGHIARRNLRDRNEGSTGVAHVGQADGVPGRAGVRFTAIQLVGDVVHDGSHHGLDHVTGFRRARGYRSGFNRRNGDTDTGRVDVLVGRVAMEFVHHDEAARVAQPFDIGHGIDALEGRQHHVELEFDLVLLDHLAGGIQFIDVHLAVLDLGGLGVGDPVDVMVAQLGFEHGLGIAHAAETKMTDIGFGGHIGHRELVAYLALAQVGVDDEGKLVGRAEAAGKGHGADDDRAWLFQGFLVFLIGLFGVIHGADGIGVTAVGTGTLDLLEGEARAGDDDEVVVFDMVAIVEGQLVAVGIDLGDSAVDEVDALALEVGLDREGDRLAIAPAHGNPGVGRRELEVFVAVDDGDLVLLAQFLLHFVSTGHAAGAGAKNDDMSH